MEPRGRNRWQSRANRPPSKPQNQAKSVATGCHRLPATFHGKEGVDGSSPSEGFKKRPANGLFFVASTAYVHRSSASLNLSPGSVPNVAEALQSRLKQRRLTSSSTSMNRRYPATESRKDIDASETRRSTV